MASRLDSVRALGSTGVRVPLVGYGTAPLGKPGISREYAVSCLNHAIDRGITYIDTSPDYGSEPHVGDVMRERRHEIFLATKVNRRKRDDVLDEIEESLGRLQTDHVDLLQVHSVSAWADLEQALAEDGAVAGLEEARRRGWARFIGITGHARPALLAYGLGLYKFDTVLCALGIADHLVSYADGLVLPAAREKGVGVIAMKVLGHGCYPGVERALRYSLGLPGVSLAIVGMTSNREIDEITRIASDLRPLDEQEEERLIDETRPLIDEDSRGYQKGEAKLFWLHDTAVTGWRSKSEPATVEY